MHEAAGSWEKADKVLHQRLAAAALRLVWIGFLTCWAMGVSLVLNPSNAYG
nr:hypothetical protein [Acetivibrio clariflavus]